MGYFDTSVFTVFIANINPKNYIKIASGFIKNYHKGWVLGYWLAN